MCRRGAGFAATATARERGESVWPSRPDSSAISAAVSASVTYGESPPVATFSRPWVTSVTRAARPRRARAGPPGVRSSTMTPIRPVWLGPDDRAQRLGHHRVEHEVRWAPGAALATGRLRLGLGKVGPHPGTGVSGRGHVHLPCARRGPDGTGVADRPSTSWDGLATGLRPACDNLATSDQRIAENRGRSTSIELSTAPRRPGTVTRASHLRRIRPAGSELVRR